MYHDFNGSLQELEPNSFLFSGRLFFKGAGALRDNHSFFGLNCYSPYLRLAVFFKVEFMELQSKSC
jgi:hypothetical protein